MGIGDEIMASGQALALHEESGQKVLILDRLGRPRRHLIWQGLGFIAHTPEPGCQRLVNGPGARPYIASKTEFAWTWREFRPRPGVIALTPGERLFARPYAGRILIEPATKAPNGNKAWPQERWQQLVDLCSCRFIQVGQEGTHWLRGVETAVTTFREACAILAVSRAFVGTEGALHHAAAALGVPAVVLWSEFINPSVTGYESQRNIRHADGTCGSRIPCDGCNASMAVITVDEVAENLEAIL